jgi:hypothetical protein
MSCAPDMTSAARFPGSQTTYSEAPYAAIATPCVLTKHISIPNTSSHSDYYSNMTIGMVNPDVIYTVADLVVDAQKQTSQVKVTQTITKSPAPDATDIIYQLYHYPSASVQSNNSGRTNDKAFLGIALSSITLLLIALLFVACCRGKNRSSDKYSEAEKGRSRRGRHCSTSEVINEAHRRREHRNRRAKGGMITLAA